LRNPRDGLKILIGIIGAIGYPVLIYLTLDHISPKVLSGILVALIVARILFVKFKKTGKRPPMKAVLPFIVVSAISAALVFFLNNNTILLYIPTFVSVMLAGVFVHSIIKPPTIIEHFAEMDFPVLPPSASTYCRKVTHIWVGIFLCNAVTCFLAARYAPREVWLGWTTAGIYIFMGLCFGLEYLVRRTKVPVFDAELVEMGIDPANPKGSEA
jgi:uncharacterized membrane protein